MPSPIIPIPGGITIEERRCYEFLNRLDAALHIDVTDWEAQFIENLITNQRPLTPGQRRAIQELQTKYYGRL